MHRPEKGNKRRTIGLHYAAASAISEYIEAAGLTSGPLFRAKKSSKSDGLSNRQIAEVTMWRTVQGHLNRLPGSTTDVELPDGSKLVRRIYTPHSLRATTATLLLDSGVDITKVPRSRSSSAIATLRQHRFTTRDGGQRRRAPVTMCRFESAILSGFA